MDLCRQEYLSVCNSGIQGWKAGSALYGGYLGQKIGSNPFFVLQVDTRCCSCITAEWNPELKGPGFQNVPASHLIGIQAQNITPEYIRSLEAISFRDMEPSLIPLKALGITAEYIRDFKNKGYPNITLREVVPLKAQGITLSTFREYKAFGFENISPNDVVAARATGTTPAFIPAIKEKGQNLKSIDKYIQLKNAVK